MLLSYILHYLHYIRNPLESKVVTFVLPLGPSLIPIRLQHLLLSNINAFMPSPVRGLLTSLRYIGKVPCDDDSRRRRRPRAATGSTKQGTEEETFLLHHDIIRKWSLG